ncbi:hypothetical protein BH20CHL6_BH20CHL6_05740 [soil metagenome]
MPSLPAGTVPPVSDNGQGLAEYALILSLIAIFALTALTLLGDQIGVLLSTIADALG